MANYPDGTLFETATIFNDGDTVGDGCIIAAGSQIFCKVIFGKGCIFLDGCIFICTKKAPPPPDEANVPRWTETGEGGVFEAPTLNCVIVGKDSTLKNPSIGAAIILPESTVNANGKIKGFLQPINNSSKESVIINTKGISNPFCDHCDVIEEIIDQGDGSVSHSQ